MGQSPTSGASHESLAIHFSGWRGAGRNGRGAEALYPMLLKEKGSVGGLSGNGDRRKCSLSGQQIFFYKGPNSSI